MNIGSHHLIRALPIFSQLIAGSRGVLDFLVTYFTMFRKLISKNEIVWCEKKKGKKKLKSFRIFRRIYIYI